MKDRLRVLVLLDVPADLRPSLGRLLKALGRRYDARCIDLQEVKVDKHLAELLDGRKEELSAGTTAKTTGETNRP